MAAGQASHFWIGAAVCAAAALGALYGFLVSLRRDRLLADTPLVRLRSAAQGYVKVCGRAEPQDGTAIAAPLSQRPCVWWSYEVASRNRNSRGATQWSSVERATSVRLFVLADADAHCLVGPVNAEITPTTHDVWYGSEPRPGRPPGTASLLESPDYRYTERLLSPGDRLSVLGELRSRSELLSTDAAAVALLRHWKQDQRGLLARFDTDHDGRIDAAEWEQARQAAERESGSGALATPVTRLSVISEPRNGEPFLIAAMDARQLERRERLHALLFLGAGLLCTLLCAWAIEHAQAG
jgi:E3 ubiquitin ligase